MPTNNTWAAFQYHAPGLGGFAFVFRREASPEAEYVLRLRALSAWHMPASSRSALLLASFPVPLMLHAFFLRALALAVVQALTKHLRTCNGLRPW